MNQINKYKQLIRTLIFLFFLIPAIQAFAQNKKNIISISQDSISLKDAFTLIEQQSEYSIAYEQSGVNLERKIFISLKNVDIETALHKILRNSGYAYKINGYHILISQEKGQTQTIKGIVIDEQSQQPIPLANINILNHKEWGSSTDSLGTFIIRNIPIGRYNIQATFVGYESTTIAEVVLTSAKEVYLKIPLKENSLLLDEIVVHPVIDKNTTINPLALTGGRMLTVEEASRFAGGFDDPARLASSFAGVSGGINSNAMAIRGNSPQFTQWRMEGVEVPNPTHYADMTGLGGGLLTGLSSNILDNSDFFNGAFPSEYTNTLGGVFDMSMRNGNKNKYEHAFQLGVWGLDITSEGPLSKKQKSSYLFNYRYSFSGLSDAISGTEEGLDYQDLAFKFHIPTQKAGTLTFWGLGLLDKVLQKNEENSTEWEYVSDKQTTDNQFTKGMGGMGHKIYLNPTTYLKSSFALTYSKVYAIVDQIDDDFRYHRMAEMKNSHTDWIVSSYLNKKITEKHTNRSGFTFTGMGYNLDLAKSEKAALYEPMQQISQGDGRSYALSAFTNSVFRLNKNLDANVGLTGQYFNLNRKWSIEPRTSIRWKLPKNQSLAFAYGLNSRRDRLDYYYTKTPDTKEVLVNKKLDFSKSHHFSLSYDKKLPFVSIKIEPYYQLLYNIPVEPGTSFSILNYNGYGLDKKLVNEGRGRNYGVDVTLERYLNNEWYALFTGSLFKSEYKGGDKVWRNTRMDQRFILHALAGKEWSFGTYKHKTISANIRLTYQGGERYTPIDYEKSAQTLSVEMREEEAYSLKLPRQFISDLTIRYRVNKKKITHEFSFMILNANGFRQTGYVYNLGTDAVEKKKVAPIVPSISWKIYF